MEFQSWIFWWEILHYEEVSSVMCEAVGKGVECWNVDLKFSPGGVKLLGVTNTTENLLKY